jgi:hypothetical protein
MGRSVQPRTWAAALLVSLLVHAAVLLTLPSALVARTPDGKLPPPPPIQVSLVDRPPPPPAPKIQPPPPAPPPPPAEAVEALRPQIVAPPDTVNDVPPEKTRLESDRNNKVETQSLSPGVPKPAPEPKEIPKKPAPETRKAEAPPKPKQKSGEADDDGATRREPTRRRSPQLEDLFASRDELIRAQQSDKNRGGVEESNDRVGEGRRRLALAVPPVSPDWALPGRRGALDFLPDIQRGDVTLLNTKANVFAPFVRRVGERVFQHLVIRQRRLDLPQIMNARQPVMMKVLLDKKGRLKSVKVENQSGSASMDGTLSEAVQTGAFDNNPPPTAANADGNYEFVFQAQLRAYAPGGGGAPSRIESRLSVGLL